MHYVWTRRDVNPESVVSSVKEFFADKGFVEGPGSKLTRKKSAMFFETRQKGKFRSVKVVVIVRLDGFEIDFVSDRTAETLAKMGALSTLFGGGVLMRGKLESSDPHYYERLESDLVEYVERKIGK